MGGEVGDESNKEVAEERKGDLFPILDDQGRARKQPGTSIGSSRAPSLNLRNKEGTDKNDQDKLKIYTESSNNIVIHVFDRCQRTSL